MVTRAGHWVKRRGRRVAVGWVLMVAGAAALPARAEAAVTVGPEYTFPGGDNRSCDICVHPTTGRPHVVWETNDGHIKYSHFDGSRWSRPEQVPGPVKVGARHARFRNGAVAMVIDPAGRLHVVYTTVGPPNGLYHVCQKAAGGAWSAPVLIHNARRAELTWVKMAGDRRGKLFVTFEQGFRGFRCEYNGSKWLGPAPLIAMTSHVHHVCVGPDNVPRIIFKAKRREGYEAYLAVKRRAKWQATQITREGGHVDCPTGAVDAANKLHVLWSRCDEEGHDAVLKYQMYGGAMMAGRAIAKSNAHNFCRLVIDAGGAFYAFMPRRYPPKFVVRETPGGPWSKPIALGGARQGYWLFEAAAHGNEVHLVYSNSYGPDRRKAVTYRKITRTKGPPGKPPRARGPRETIPAATPPSRRPAPGSGLRPDPSNPRWLIYRGKHIALSGNGLWVLLPDADVKIIEHNTHAARWGANSNRITLFTACDRDTGGEYAPWARPGPRKANDGRPKYDLSRFDKAYWRRAVQYVRDAASRGIHPVIQIWCEPYLERGEGRWIVHPFNPDNNINNILRLPKGSADAGRETAFYNTGNRKLIHLQERFVRKALDELGCFPVIWDIGNEVGLDTKISDTWMRHWADFFDAYEASHPGVTILSTVDTNSDRGHFDRITNLDVINVHGFADSNPFTLSGDPQRSVGDSRVDVKAMQKTLNRHYAHFRKPLINTRITADPDYAGRTLRDRPGNALETRHVLWGYFFGGAHFISFRTRDAAGSKPGLWDDPPRTTEHAQRHLRTFIDSFEFWKCAPDTGRIVAGGDAVVLAERGRQYAFYAPNGNHCAKSFTADLSAARGADLQARWFDPRKGQFRTPLQITAGPAVKFTLPTDEDWALLLQSKDGRASKGVPSRAGK